MSALEKYRTMVRAVLCDTGFLRRDTSGTALFVTDYIRRGGAIEALDRLAALGFVTTERAGLWHIDLSPCAYRALCVPYQPTPPAVFFSDAQRMLYDIALRLSRADFGRDDQPVAPVRRTLLMLNERAYALLAQELNVCIADILRTHQALPTACGTLIKRALF